MFRHRSINQLDIELSRFYVCELFCISGAAADVRLEALPGPGIVLRRGVSYGTTVRAPGRTGLAHTYACLPVHRAFVLPPLRPCLASPSEHT